jgi:hypothetical protein
LFTIAKYREAFGFDAVFFIEQTEVDVLWSKLQDLLLLGAPWAPRPLLNKY